MKKDTVDILKLLEDGRTIQLKPRGYSMYPLLVPGRDSAVLIKAETDHLKRGDVVLYKREQGILVLHRIWKIKGDNIYLVGDNQQEVEGPLRKEQVKGIMVAFVRKGKTISVNSPVYWLVSRLWLAVRPYRGMIKKFAAGAVKALRR